VEAPRGLPEKRLEVESNVAAPEPTTVPSEWLTLEQAAKRLGVHCTTLRRWANQGAIDVFLTPGGHRRFRREDIERFEREHRQTHLPALPVPVWADHAIAHAREGVPQQRWVVAYDESEREVKRQLGRRLMGLVFQYVVRPDDSPGLLSEARLIGEEHARQGLQHAQPLNDLLQAITFFRTTLLEVAILELPGAVATRPEASTQLLRKIERLLGEVQAGVVEIYTGGGISCG